MFKSLSAGHYWRNIHEICCSYASIVLYHTFQVSHHSVNAEESNLHFSAKPQKSQIWRLPTNLFSPLARVGGWCGPVRFFLPIPSPAQLPGYYRHCFMMERNRKLAPAAQLRVHSHFPRPFRLELAFKILQVYLLFLKPENALICKLRSALELV